MWDVYPTCDLFLITTNSFLKMNGALVMGAGIAKEARDKFPGLDLALGKQIKHLSKYGVLISPKFPEAKLGAFQVKYNYKDNASLELIKYSTQILIAVIDGMNLYDCDINLNYPGIGNGHLLKKDVKKIVDKLPNNVKLWELN